MNGYGISFIGDFAVMSPQLKINTTTAEIPWLIDCLNSLRDGDHAVDLLVACGERSIEYLRKFLMEGYPSHIYQPRQRAVNALARLGAKEALIEYLCAEKDIPDPVYRHGEEAVENTAARSLSRWQTEDVFQVLWKIAQTRTLPGVIDALSSFRRCQSIPIFIAALMDDVSRPAAESALTEMGETVKPALIEAACASDPSENYVSPSLLLCRRSAVRILADMVITADEWSRLKCLLTDEDPEIAISAARIALELSGTEDTNTAIKTLIEKITLVNWYILTEIENCLVRHYGMAKEEIAVQIAERNTQPENSQISDRLLQILLNIKNRGEARKNAGQ